MLEQVKEYFGGLEPGPRRILMGTIVLTIFALAGVGWWSWTDRYKVVFSSNNPSEVQEVASVLEEEGIPYMVSQDGLAVEVLPQHEGQARIAGASAGKVIGFEVLDAIELGTSPQRERWAYQRALQGELAKTINSMDEVEASRVHLVIPERSAFIRDQRPPSASVTINLQPGAALSKNQLRGITSMVAGAVDGLPASEVVLVDGEGRLLSGPDERSEELGGMPDLLALREAEEQRTRNSILEAMVSVLGSPNDVTVGVTVDVETSANLKTTRSQDPNTQVVVSETIREEKSDSVQPEGVPGVDANLPEEAAGTNRTETQSTLEQRSNYAYTEVNEQEERSPGTIKRLSVGVVVNSDRVELLAKALVKEPDQDLADVDIEAARAKAAELQQQIENTVKMAMGYDETRMDSVVVTFLPFSATETTTGAETAEESFFIERYGPILLGGLGLLLFFWVIIRPLVGAVVRASTPAGSVVDDMGGDPDDLSGLLPDVYAGLSDDEMKQRQATRNLSDRLRSMVDNYESVQSDDLNRLVDLERESTAQVLRRWIRKD
jgi:flagellar M-ring protein FliF